MITRILEHKLLQALNQFRILLLLGSRRSGKSTLLEKLYTSLPNKKVLRINDRESEDFNMALQNKNKSKLKELLKNYDYLFLDNAQEYSETELNFLIRSIRTKMILTSSKKIITKYKFADLASFILHPVSIKELFKDDNDAKTNIEQLLIYGSYPEVIDAQHPKNKIIALNKILEKNIMQKLNNQKIELDKLFNLLKFLAINIGQNLSYPILISNLKIDKNTLKIYLEVLQDHFIIFSIYSFSRNLPKEMSKAQKFYFWDNGIRNLLINNFSSIDNRTDANQLWENFCISERLKRNQMLNFKVNSYFWRTYDRKEIPYLEETHGYLFAYNFSWRKSPSQYPRQFLNAYPNSVYSIINLEKFWDFIG